MNSREDLAVVASRELLTAQLSPPLHPDSHTQRHKGGEKMQNRKREEERTDFANQSCAPGCHQEWLGCCKLSPTTPALRCRLVL